MARCANFSFPARALAGTVVGILTIFVLLSASQPSPFAPPPPKSIQLGVAQHGAKFTVLNVSEMGTVRITLAQAQEAIRRSGRYTFSPSFGFAYLGSYYLSAHPHRPPPAFGTPAYVIQTFWMVPGHDQSSMFVAVNAVSGDEIEAIGPCIGPECRIHPRVPLPTDR
jgi:hypothetical protein